MVKPSNLGSKLMWSGLFLLIAFVQLVTALGSNANTGVFALVGAVLFGVGLAFYWFDR